MSKTQVLSNSQTPTTRIGDKQNDNFQFLNDSSHSKQPMSLAQKNHNLSQTQTHSQPFQNLTNKTFPKSITPAKPYPQPINSHQTPVESQQHRKQPSSQTQKQPLKVKINEPQNKSELKNQQKNQLQTQTKTSPKAQVKTQNPPQPSLSNLKDAPPITPSENPSKKQTTNKSLKSMGKIKLKPINTEESQIKEQKKPQKLKTSTKPPSNVFLPNDSQLQENLNSNHLELTKSDLLVAPSIFQECSHVMKPIKANFEIEHVFNRHTSCALSEPVNFILPTKNAEFLSSQKTSRFSCSQFQVFLNKNGKQNLLGTFRSNFLGSTYNFYPYNSDAIYFSVIFKTKSNQISQNFRYCELYLNKGIVEGEGNQHLIPYDKMDSLEGLFLVNKTQKNNGQRTEIEKFSAKLPIYSPTQQCYGLKFPKKSMPSAKNTILEDELGREVLKFYKNSHLTYNVTFESPISWVTAYCYSLATTDFKLFTE